MRRSFTGLVGVWTVSLLCLVSTASAGDIFGHVGLTGGSRWDAAPRIISGNERSLDGCLRYSMDGGSFQAYRDLFQWTPSVPSVADFQLAIERSFDAWTSTDPASGLGSDLCFVADLATPVVDTGSFGGVNINGAEIDLLADDGGDPGTRGVAFFNAIGSRVTLTSGTSNYPGSFAISGADVTINNNSGAAYTLDLFRRLMTHELGHAIGLGDVENANFGNEFIDDNYDPSSPSTALATLTNSWAAMVNPLNPAASPGLSLYTVADGNPGIDTPGVNILMESNGLGIGPGNPVTELVPLRNDDYGTRQFLYPFVSNPVSGDFTSAGGSPDGVWDCFDIDALTAAIASLSTDLSFDMNGDGAITLADITDNATGWLAVGGAQNPAVTGGNAFLAGDANLDGVVDGQDFVVWNSNKFINLAEWCSGDFTADGVIDGQDFIVWNGNKFMSSTDVLGVPEPVTATSLIAAWWVLMRLIDAGRRRRE